MVAKTQKESKQTRAARELEEEAILSIARTSEFITSAIAAVLRAADLTPTQYNVLRILRSAGSDGLSCSEISDRMVTKESDVTRLLDRIENRGLITRERPANNRRTVITRISDEGLRLLAELDAPIETVNHRLVGHLGETKLKTLNRLLAAVREAE